jgi:hypothetical protein
LTVVVSAVIDACREAFSDVIAAIMAVCSTVVPLTVIAKRLS